MDQEEVKVVINNKNRKRLSVGNSECLSPAHDVVSVFSGMSGRSKVTVKEDKGITMSDIKAIMPTVIILLVTIFIMVTVIPYAFSSVITQLHAVQKLEAEAAAAKMTTSTTESLPETVTVVDEVDVVNNSPTNVIDNNDVDNSPSNLI